MFEVDLSSVYAPDSDEPLLVESATIDIVTEKVWIRDPNVYGRGEDNKFTLNSNKSLSLVMKDYQGNTYRASMPVKEVTINQDIREPDE